MWNKREGDAHMTLQQMRYAVMVAEKQSFGKAALALFISQPSLSNAIHSLEEELDIKLFIRTSKGVEIAPRGYVFIESAKRIISQTDAVLKQYTSFDEEPFVYFGVSSLQYAFASKAFSKMLASMDGVHYNLCIRDTHHLGVIQDVASQRSEIGVLDTSFDSEPAVTNLLKKNHLEFTLLHTAQPHVLLNSSHPLFGRKSIRLEELASYPYIYYERETQSSGDSLILTKIMPQSRLQGKDRSTLIMLLRSTNGYAISNGLLDKEVYSDLAAIPIEDICEKKRVGWVKRADKPLSSLGEKYIQYLKDEISMAIEHQSDN